MVIALTAVAFAGLIGLAFAIEAIGQAPSLNPECWRVFVGGLRERIASGLWPATGVMLLTTALALSGRRVSAFVPAVLLYAIPAVALEIAVDGPVGWLPQDAPTGWWLALAVLVEAGLMFGPALVVIQIADRPMPTQGIGLAIGLFGPPAVTGVWLLAAFTAPTLRDVALMCVTATAVLSAGLLADPASTPRLTLTALGTAITVRAVDLGSGWPVLATACLAVGVAAAAVAPSLWAGRDRPLGRWSAATAADVAA